MPRIRGFRGFTLVELMIVVVIIVILATIGAAAYKRYMARARITEVYAMFAEIRAKEEAYRAEYGTYLNVGASESAIYPAMSTGNEPVAKTWAPASAAWGQMGIRPPASQVYCGYNIVAAAANSWGTGSTFVQGFMGATAPAVDWWAAIAMCDNDNTSGTLSWTDPNNAKFITSSLTTAVRDDNATR